MKWKKKKKKIKTDSPKRNEGIRLVDSTSNSE